MTGTVAVAPEGEDGGMTCTVAIAQGVRGVIQKGRLFPPAPTLPAPPVSNCRSSSLPPPLPSPSSPTCHGSRRLILRLRQAQALQGPCPLPPHPTCHGSQWLILRLRQAQALQGPCRNHEVCGAAAADVAHPRGTLSLLATARHLAHAEQHSTPGG